MNAVIRAARGGLGARRLQAVIIGLVVLAATAASTLALGMLADAHSPFDHAFAAQRGANITAAVDASRATPAQLAATARLPGVTAAAGPYTELETTAQLSTPGQPGSRATPLRIVGRTSPGGQVDVLTLDAGRWMRNDGEIVLSRDAPGHLGSTVRIGSRTLTVVGVADSVTNTAQAWVLPSAIAGLGGTSGAGQAQMLYRFARAGSAAAIAADAARHPGRAAAPGAAQHRLLPRRAAVRAERHRALGAVHRGVRRDRPGHLDADRGERGQRCGDRRHDADRRLEVHRVHAGPGRRLVRAAGDRAGGARLRGRGGVRQPARDPAAGPERQGLPGRRARDPVLGRRRGPAGRARADHHRGGPPGAPGGPDERGAGDRHRTRTANGARLRRAPPARPAEGAAADASRSGSRRPSRARPGRW